MVVLDEKLSNHQSYNNSFGRSWIDQILWQAIQSLSGISLKTTKVHLTVAIQENSAAHQSNKESSSGNHEYLY